MLDGDAGRHGERERESERGAEIDKQTDRQGQLREKSV